MRQKETNVEKAWLKHVVPGNPKEVKIPLISIPQLLDESITKYPNHIRACRDGRRWY